MDFEWDEVKSAANLARRGFGFDFAARIFEGPVIECPDDRARMRGRRMAGCRLHLARRGSPNHLGPQGQPEGAPQMTVVRKTLAQIRREGGSVNRKRLAATTDADIARQIAEDADTAPDLSTLPPLRVMVKSVRVRLGLTQEEMAASLRISVATLRNWEQGRTRPEGPAEALLTALDRNPRAVLRALAG